MNERFANTARQIHLALIQSLSLQEVEVESPEFLAKTAICHAAAIEAAIARHESEAIKSADPSPSSESPWTRLSENEPACQLKCWVISVDQHDDSAHLTWGFWNNEAGWIDEFGMPLPKHRQLRDNDTSAVWWTPYSTFDDILYARASFRQHHQK